MKALITFLGGVKRSGAGYEDTTYQLPDGTRFPSKYVGRVLAQYSRPDRLVILGTSSSMWDVFVEDVVGESATPLLPEEMRLELMAAVEAREVQHQLLERIADSGLRTFFGVKELRLIRIPEGRTDAEQLEILDAIASSAEGASHVEVDVTHGFRHLGMLGFLSAFVIERMQAHVQVNALWYGAREMARGGNEFTPVVKLDGLLSIQHWVDALNRFDASGDYGVFAPLLERDGVARDKAECLRQAAFLEKTLNLNAARTKLCTFLPVLDEGLPGASGLFQERLRKHLDWVRKPGLAGYQQVLAQRALARNDYLRSAIFAVESFISNLFESNDYSQLDFKVREQAEKELGEDFRSLKHIRNAMAHALPADRTITTAAGKKRKLSSLLKDEEALKKELQAYLDLLAKASPQPA